MVTIAKCCKPVKGDSIVGFITKGRGVTIHKSSCYNIKLNKERLIGVRWNYESETIFLTDLYIETLNNKNYLTDIIAIITKKNLNIDSIKTTEYSDNYLYLVTLKVKNNSDIDKIIIDLENNSFINKVWRG